MAAPPGIYEPVFNLGALQTAWIMLHTPAVCPDMRVGKGKVCICPRPA